MADDIMTFDEILEDPTYKSEFDRRVTKALSTVQAKLDAVNEILKRGNDAQIQLNKGRIMVLEVKRRIKYKETDETLV